MTLFLPDLALGTFFFAGFTTTTVLAASAASTAVGAYISAKGQSNAADAADKTAQYNSKIQRSQAVAEMEAAKENSRRKARDNARIIGQQRAALAQSGFAMEGTPLAVLGETAMTLQRDILDMGHDAQARSNTYKAGANMSIWDGKNQSSALRTGAITSGLAGVSSIANGYLDAKGYPGTKPVATTTTTD